MFARTRRLTLRPGWPEDAGALAAAIGHEAVVTRLSRVPWPYGEADAAWWLACPRGRDDMFCLILDHPAGGQPRLVGGIGLHVEGGDMELGYWLTPAAWGRGYATEAGRAAVDIARDALGRRRLTARHHHDNAASARVLAKLGFQPTGEVRQQHSRALGIAVATPMLRLDLTRRAALPAAA